jgi:hypothetical protein
VAPESTVAMRSTHESVLNNEKSDAGLQTYIAFAKGN